jgi:hypothetical protein
MGDVFENHIYDAAPEAVKVTLSPAQIFVEPVVVALRFGRGVTLITWTAEPTHPKASDPKTV